jgi:hypothetical protein
MSTNPGIVRRRVLMGLGSPQEDILKLIDSLEDLTDRPYSLFNRAWGVDLEEFHMLTNKIRASLPDEVRKAKNLTSDSDKIVAATREEAEAIEAQARLECDRITKEAREMATHLIETSEVSKMAKAQAQEILSGAEKAAREQCRGADEYAKQVLISVENHLAKVMGTLQRGRDQLDMRIDNHEADTVVLPATRGARR